MCLKLLEGISNKTFETLIQGAYVNISFFNFSVWFAFIVSFKKEKFCFGLWFLCFLEDGDVICDHIFSSGTV